MLQALILTAALMREPIKPVERPVWVSVPTDITLLDGTVNAHGSARVAVMWERSEGFPYQPPIGEPFPVFRFTFEGAERYWRFPMCDPYAPVFVEKIAPFIMEYCP